MTITRIIPILIFSCTALFSAPAMVSVTKRVQMADRILVVQVKNVQIAAFNNVSKRAHLTVSTIEALKGQNPGDFNLAFLVFPETFENHLREPVDEGKYIVFLKNKAVGQRTGDIALVLLEPRHFAFIEYNSSILKKIKKLLPKTN